MPLTRTKKIVLAGAAVALLVAGIILARHFSIDSGASARQELLQLVLLDVGEEGTQRIEITLGEWIIFMIVTLGAAHRRA